MRVKSLNVLKYGILENKRFNFSPDINLHVIYGRNETGKTLAIDAVSRMLLPAKPDPAKQPSKYGFREHELNRVAYFPEGYVMLQDRHGKEHKIAEKSSLLDLINMPQKAMRNILMIRNSDLLILEEDDFYKLITHHISGMKIADINKIKEKIRVQQRLTESLKLSNRGEDFKLAERVQEAEHLIENINGLLHEAKSQGYDVLEKELIELRNHHKLLSWQIEEQELAHYREKYEKASGYFDNLIQAKEKLEALQGYTQEELEKWKDLSSAYDQLQENYQAAKQKLSTSKEQLQTINSQLEEMNQEYRHYEQKKSALEKYEPEIETMQKRETELAGKEKSQQVWSSTWKVFAALLGLSLFGAILFPGSVMPILAIVLAVPTILLMYPKFKFAREKAAFAKDLNSLKNDLGNYGIGGKALEEWGQEIARIKEKINALNEVLSQELLPQKKSKENEVEYLSHEEIPKIENKMNATSDQMERIKFNSGVESMEAYKEKLKQKQKYQQIVSNRASALESLLGSQKKRSDDSIIDDIDKELPYWREAINRLAQYQDKARGAAYSPHKLEELESRKKNIESRIEDIKQKISYYQDQLKNIEERASKALYPDDAREVFCQTTTNLEELKGRLHAFIEKNKLIREAAQKAFEIFNHIASREEQKIEALFSEAGAIKQFFLNLTEGNYRNVFYDRENQQIICETTEGLKLDANKLSGFAFDQLYFSIRLALANKIMDQESGFLILDDPFIKADIHRLKNQLNMLKETTKSNWQIIYFTAKDEIKQVLAPFLKQKEAELLEM